MLQVLGSHSGARPCRPQPYRSLVD
ncbi:MAG: phage DNA packaging protein J [Magnetospirillum sp.]|nr:phage DNA packaging protein J [Magnetospirillum sp.]